MSVWTSTVVPDVNISPRTQCDMQTWYGSSRLWTSLQDSIANTNGRCPWIKFLLNYNRVFRHNYRDPDKSLARPGRKQANVSVRMAWISFGALPCRGKKTWWQLASRCCWNRARPWHASELFSFLVGLRTYQHPGMRQSKFCRRPCPSLRASIRR